MTEALRLDIVLQSEQAQRAADNFSAALQRMGVKAEDAAKEVEQFEKELAKAQTRAAKTQAIDGARDSTDQYRSAVGQLSQELIRYAGPAALGAALKKSIDFADSIQDLSQQSGFTTTAVQTLGHVAQKAGSSFQAVANAANLLDRNLSVAAPRTVEAISRLGLSIDELLRMQPEDRFRAIGIAIGNTSDPAQRAELAMALFGRAGTDLLATFRDLAEGAETFAPRMSSAWVENMAMVSSATETAWGHLKNMGMWLLTFPIHQTMQAWAEAVSLYEAAVNRISGVPNAPGRPPGMPPVGNQGIDPLAGQSMGYWERILTQGARTSGPGGGGLSPRVTTSTSFRLADWLAGSPFMNFAPFLPGVPMNAPGGLLGATQNLNWAGFPGTVPMHAPGGSGGGFRGFMGSGAGRMLGFGMGMLPGLIPGMSGIGSGLGSAAGSAIGSLSSVAGMAIAPFLGPLGGILGGLFGKLFGPSEGKKTNRTRDAFITENFGSVDALRDAAEKAGFSVDRMLSVKKVKDFQAEVNKLNKAISESEADAQRTEEAMARWGLSIEDMGPKFKQTKINDAFKEAMEDLRVLTNAGADFNVVAEKMAPQLGAMVHEAIEMGSTVPKEMEPIIRKMIEMGILVDKNGDKFTEIGQIPFAQDLNKDFGILIGKMDALIQKISQLPGLFGAATDAANELADTAPDGGGVPGSPSPGNPGGTPSSFASSARAGVVGVTINVAGYLDSPSARQNLASIVSTEIGKELRMRRAG